MKLEALMAVLKALSGKCKEDMADKFSSPEDKMGMAMEDVKAKPAEDEEEEELELPEALAEEKGEEEEEELDPVKAGLKDFFKAKKPPASKPGTAVMIAVEKKKPNFKKG